MTWNQGTSTDEQDMVDQLEQLATGRHVSIAQVNAGGTGYVVGDVCTVDSGTRSHDSTVEVTSVVAGVVSGIRLRTGGAFTVDPTLVGASTTGGTGTGLTLDLVMTDTGWTSLRDTTVSGDRELVLQGDAPGSQDPIVAVRSWTATTPTRHNWALFGMTAFDGGDDLDEQADISPGLDGANGISANGGCFCPLKPDDADPDIDWYISITPRRIMGFFFVQSGANSMYTSFHVGLLNQAGTTDEMLYPLYVAASTNRFLAWHGETTGLVSGLSECVFLSTSGGGAVFWHEGDSAWVDLRNLRVTTDTDLVPDRAVDTDGAGVFPVFSPDRTTGVTPDTVADTICDIPASSRAVVDWRDLTLEGSVEYHETDPSGDALHPLIPCIAMRSDGSSDEYEVFGEIDGLFWVSGETSGGTRTPVTDYIRIGTTDYRYFRNGNRTERWSFCAVRED